MRKEISQMTEVLEIIIPIKAGGPQEKVLNIINRNIEKTRGKEVQGEKIKPHLTMDLLEEGVPLGTKWMRNMGYSGRRAQAEITVREGDSVTGVGHLITG